jgi:hypothetical protein
MSEVLEERRNEDDGEAGSTQWRLAPITGDYVIGNNVPGRCCPAIREDADSDVSVT